MRWDCNKIELLRTRSSHLILFFDSYLGELDSLDGGRLKYSVGGLKVDGVEDYHRCTITLVAKIIGQLKTGQW